MGEAIAAIAGAVSGIAVCAMVCFLFLMVCITFLRHTDKITTEEMERLLDRVLPKKKQKW